jgi:type I restriction enzyme S subunit
MSNLSFMEKLLDGVDVELKALGDEGFVDVANSGRKPVKASLRVAGKIPYYGANNIQDYVDGYTHDGEYVLIAEDGSASLENYSIQYVSGKFWANNHVHVIRGKSGLNTRFLYHYLCIVNFNPFLTGGGRAKLTKGKMVEIQIPIPCPENAKKSLEIQAEIVRILDTFTELTTELTTELKARKKQYDYYREQLLLDSNSRVEKLEDIADIYLGLTYTPKYVERGVKFISAKDTSKDFLDLSNTKYISEDEYFNSTSNAKPKRGDVLFTRVGSNLGHPVIVDTDEPLCIFVSLGYIRVNPKKCLNSYIKHWMNTELFWAQMRTKTYGAAKVNLNTGWLKKFDVLLPSLEEQARIVVILDKFDTLTNSITEGLPREIAFRQKQYGYYRDLLLSFPKSDAEVAA